MSKFIGKIQNFDNLGTVNQQGNSPLHCTKCNSLHIKGQCTNHHTALWWSFAVGLTCPVLK